MAGHLSGKYKMRIYPCLTLLSLSTIANYER